jgi:hypothetical protein
MEEDMEEDDTAVPHAPTPATAPRPHLSARLYPTASTHGDGGLPMFHGEVEGVRNDDYEDNNPYIASGILGEDAFGGEGDDQQGAANESSALGQPDPPRRRLPRIGAENTVWRGCAGSFAADHLVEASEVEREHRRRASRILTACVVRRCMRSKNREEWESLNPGVRKMALQEEMATYGDLLAGLKESRFVNDLISVENFMLHVDPDCEFSKFIKTMTQIAFLDPGSTDVTVQEKIKEAVYLKPEPMKLAHMQCLIASCVTAADSDELDFEHDGRRVRVRGQGLGYPQVYASVLDLCLSVLERVSVCVRVCACVVWQVHAYWCAIARIHAVLGIPHLSPTKAAEAKERIKKLRELHRTEHCSTLDLYEDLPLIREAIFKLENKPWSKNRAKQHHHWALLLYLLEHAHRCATHAGSVAALSL